MVTRQAKNNSTADCRCGDWTSRQIAFRDDKEWWIPVDRIKATPHSCYKKHKRSSVTLFWGRNEPTPENLLPRGHSTAKPFRRRLIFTASWECCHKSIRKRMRCYKSNSWKNFQASSGLWRRCSKLRWCTGALHASLGSLNKCRATTTVLPGVYKNFTK